MCVIIKREPKVIIPEEKIISACTVNPDGFGFSVVDRGRLETIKVHKSGGNDPDEIMRLLEQAEDHLVYLHLRFTTAGKTNEENCHPFQTFKGDNFEVQFMHNGTLSKFSKGKDDDHSDTWHFNEEILKPTIRAFYEVDGAGVLLNPVVKKILSEFSGTSVFTLYDNEGNTLLIETSACKNHEGWWSSNTYSFDRYHRTGYSTGYYQGNRSCGVPPVVTNRPTLAPASNHLTTTKTTTAAGASKNSLSFQEQKENECAKLGYAIMQTKKHNVSYAKHTPPTERLTFAELAQISSLKNVEVLTEGDLYDLVVELPIAATALLMDLIYELYTKEKAAELAKAKEKTIEQANNVTQLPDNRKAS